MDWQPELTEREKDVLFHVINGLTNREVAARLHLSETTVKFHLSNVYRKVGVKSRLQLLTWGFENGDLSERIGDGGK